MLINNTVLGNAPFRTTLVVVSLFLTCLFTLMKPEVSQGLAFFPRLAFWLLQVTNGMLGIVIASLLVRHISDRDFHILLLLGITGVAGSLIAAPFFVLIDAGFPGIVEEPDSWLDEVALNGPVQAVLVEFVDVLPALLTSWYVVNLPLILNTTIITSVPPEDPKTDDDKDQGEQQNRQKVRDQFFSRLPKVIGQDIVSISSDLHYLNVTTTLGHSLILGSLSHIAEAFEDEGFLVHRSHWVSKHHVLKVYIAGKTAYCDMSNHTQIPISRSNRKLVKSYFGKNNLPFNKPTEPKLRSVK